MPLLSRPHLSAAALIASAAALTAACGESERPARPPAGPAATATVDARPTLDSQLRRVVAGGAPGVIALVDDGHRVRLRARGVTDKRGGHVMRPTDRFRAGSMTKSFVATVMLQLAGEGKLSLTDTVERRLPDALPYGDKVTVRQLLNLTSGVPDNQYAVDAAWRKSLTHSWSPRELVALVADRKPDFAPGGYAFVGGKPLEVTALNPSGTWAAGNMVSTVSDIARFWRALLGGKLLAPAQLTAMKSTVPSWKGLPYRYGLGIQEIPTACGTMWGNGGDIAGFSNILYNNADGTRQAGVMIGMNPMPKRLSEPFGQAKRVAISDAMGSPGLC